VLNPKIIEAVKATQTTDATRLELRLGNRAAE
jgi:hypothetical protein